MASVSFLTLGLFFIAQFGIYVGKENYFLSGIFSSNSPLIYPCAIHTPVQRFVPKSVLQFLEIPAHFQNLIESHSINIESKA